MEIERKFLVKEAPDGVHGVSIEQGYLALDGDVEVRMRRRGDAALTLTIKAGAGRTRIEQELELDPASFEELWPLTQGRRVSKQRARLGAIELDVYRGALAGLEVAEVEFDTEASADAYEPPAWLGRELTGDSRYSNRNLALHGRPA